MDNLIKWQTNFRTQQFYTLLALAIMPLLLSLVTLLPLTRNFIIMRTRNQLEIVADLKQQEINNWIENGYKLATILSERIPYELTGDELGYTVDNTLISSRKEHVEKLLHTVNDAFPEILSISLVGISEGRVLISTNPTYYGRDRSFETYFVQGQQDLYASPVNYSIGQEAPLLTISAPVYVSEDQLLAVLAIEMNLDDLAQSLVNTSGLGSSGQIYLIESYGFYVTSVDGGTTPLRGIAESEGINRVLRGESGYATYQNPQDISVMGVYNWLPDVNMGLMVEIANDEFTKEYSRIWLLIILGEFILLFLAIMVANRLSSHLVSPIERISASARALKNGDLNQRTKIEGAEEIRFLAQTFNEMASSLQSTYKNLEERVAQRTMELSDANERILKSESRFRSLVENSPDYIMIIDASYKIQYINILSEGFTLEDIAGMDIFAYLPDDIHDLAKTKIDGVRATLKADTYETIGFRRNGDIGVMNVRVVPIIQGAKVENVMLVTTDITEQKEAEQNIRKQAHLLDLIFEHMLDSMAILDKDFNFVRVSKTYANAGQQPVDAYIGRNHFEMYPSDFEAEALQVKETKDIYYQQRRPFVYPDHPEKTTYWNIGFVPMLDHEDNVDLFLLTLKDVTSTVMAEQTIKKALREKEILLQEIHHRVKNNLQVISSLLRMQSMNIQDPESLGFFRDSEARIRSMAIIHEQLYQSRDFGQIDFKNYIQRLVQEIASIQDVRNIVVDTSDMSDIILSIDRAVPCGLLVNEIVTNAYKHAFPDGSGEITIKINQENDHYTLSIADDGVGLPQDIDGKNTLGMRIIKTLAMQLDAVLDIQSETGTQVTIKFKMSERHGS